MISTLTRRKSLARFLGPSLASIAFISFLILIVHQEVSSTPPTDFLVYTSQQAKAQPENSNNSSGNRRLEEMPHKILSLLQNASHTHDNDLIDLETARYAWNLMERRALHYTRNHVETLKPFVRDLLIEAQVSSQCQAAISGWLDKLENLDHWAALMWNSWGSFPSAGLFEGSFTDLGSYRGCMSIKDNELIGQSQYCTLDYQPLVPTRPRFHSIFKRVLDVDPRSGLLTGGDFDQEHSRSGGKAAFSKLASHEFSSHRYREGEEEREVMIPASSENSSLLHSNTLNKTLKTGTIIALSKKAQFFYYVKLRIGTCWPTKCSKDDVQSMAQYAGSMAVLQASEVSCITKKEHSTVKLNTHQWVAIISLTALASIPIFASMVDILRSLLVFYQFKKLVAELDEYVEGFLIICSLQRNLRKLFLVKPTLPIANSAMHTNRKQHDGDQPVEQLTCLHGLRIISMIWVIYGHTLLNIDYQSFTHSFKALENDMTSIVVLPTLIANFSVDTFFVISGLLGAYIIFSLKIRFNAILFTIARYIRLTPQLIIVILIFFLLPLFGDGPLFRQGTEVHAERCYKNYWLNLLYLQSYINRKELCIIPSWWLSIEMTFHFISLFVTYTLIKSPKRGMLLNFSIVGVLTLIGSYIHYIHGFSIQYMPSIPQRYEIEIEQTQWFFHQPYPHAAAYFIGLALGYALAEKTIKKLTRIQLVFGWCLCAFGILASLCGPYYWNLGASHTQLEGTIFYNVCQVLWPISIGWIILVCSLGYGGPVNEVLSAKIFIPLGRITYMTYLSHIIVVYLFSASLHQTIEPSSLNITYIFVTNTVLSLVLGTVLSLVYEAPMLNLQRMALRRNYQRLKVKVISPDANGLSNQLIIKAEETPLNKLTRS